MIIFSSSITGRMDKMYNSDMSSKDFNIFIISIKCVSLETHLFFSRRISKGGFQPARADSNHML